MFIYTSNNAENRKEIESEKVNKAELQYKWLMFQRFFNSKAAHVGGPLTGPDVEILLKHFYEVEIDQQYKFNEIELVNSIRRNLFRNFNFNNMAD